MNIDIKQWCPQVELLLEEYHVTRMDDKVFIPKLVKLAKQLERQTLTYGHEQLTCCNCGAVRNDSEELIGTATKLAYGIFQCPLCGQENHWRRISRFVTT